MTTVLDIYNSGTDLEVITVVKSDTVTDQNAIHKDMASQRSSVALKSSASNNDYILIEDSEDSNNKKSLKISGVSLANLSGNLDSVSDGSTYKKSTNDYTSTEKTKLSNIEENATANDTDENLKNRQNHTGTQLASTISDFQDTVDLNTTLSSKIGNVVEDTSPQLGGNLDLNNKNLVGNIRLSDTVWDDIRVAALSTKANGSKIPNISKVIDNGSGSQGIITYVFNSTVEKELYFAVQIPHKWKLETSIHPHVHWVPIASGGVGEKVSWGLEYSTAKIGTTFPNSTIIFGNTTFPDEDLIVKKHYLTEIGIIDMTGIDSVSPMIMCRVFRDATSSGLTDNYGSDAALLEIDFHYEIDSLGSDTEYIK
jgi:hypothetical protein